MAQAASMYDTWQTGERAESTTADTPGDKAEQQVRQGKGSGVTPREGAGLIYGWPPLLQLSLCHTK